MDKDLSKRLFTACGVPTAPWLMAPVDPSEAVEKLGLPVVVKPNQQGSSIGLSVVRQPDELDAAVRAALEFDPEVMLEKFVSGRELTVGILDGEALAVGEIIPVLSEIFDYESKYQKGGATEIFPAEIPEEVATRVRELGLAAHEALKLGDYSRVDFRMDADGGLWCLEVNTLPGMTGTSLLPQSAAAVGMSFGDLCEKICGLALR